MKTTTASLAVMALLMLTVAWACNGFNGIGDGFEVDKGRRPRETPVTYLVERPSPCSEPYGTEIPPCARRGEFRVEGLIPGGRTIGDDPWEYEQLLYNSFHLDDVDESPNDLLLGATHMVALGKFLADTMRCASYPVLLPQWAFPENEPGVITAEIYEKHGTGTLRHFLCHSDFEVHEYFVDHHTGPPVLTVTHPRFAIPYEAAEGGDETLAEIETRIVNELAPQIDGIEWVVWLAPSYTTALESWMVMMYWDLQYDEDTRTIERVVSPDYGHFKREGLRQDKAHLAYPTLDRFRGEIDRAYDYRTARNAGRIGLDVDTPMVVENANYVEDYFREIGAYDGPLPTPAPPPPLSE